MTPLVTAVLIARDEEDRLPACLSSLAGRVDAVLVADTGSTDRTRAVALRLGARVVDVPWTDDFAAARNAALAHVTTPWALHVDADEVLLPGQGCAGLAALLARTDADVLTAVTHHLGTDRSTTEVRPGLLRVGTVRWEGRVHEQVVRRDGRPVVRAVSGWEVEHHGYLPAELQRKGTRQRNLRLAQLRHAEAPDATSAFELARAHQLADEPFAARGFYAEALRGLPQGSPARVVAHRALARVALLAEECDAAVGHARAALSEGPRDDRSLLVLAEALLAHGDVAGAAAAAEQVGGPLGRLAEDLELAQACLGFGPAARSSVALGLERTDPRRALLLHRLTPGRDGLLGRARCLVALGRLPGATRVLHEWEPSGDERDVLVAALQEALGTYPVG